VIATAYIFGKKKHKQGQQN